MKLLKGFIWAILVILTVNAKRYYIIPYIRTRDLIMEKSENRPRFELPDLRAQSTERSEHYGNRGRVMIKVYRGPDEGDHAPHGYWVRQPAEEY